MAVVPPRPSRLRLALWFGWRIVVVALLVWVSHEAIGYLVAWVEASERADMLMAGLLAVLILLYAVLISIPFVPGIEVGLALLALRGAEIAPFVYLGTVAGLLMAYCAGYVLPPGWLVRQMRRVGLTGIADFVADMDALAPEDRADRLYGLAPRTATRLALRWRYLLLAILYNLPGNAVVGGGGGISLVAGLSRVFLPGPVCLTIALAVAPVPMLVWLSGANWELN